MAMESTKEVDEQRVGDKTINPMVCIYVTKYKFHQNNTIRTLASDLIPSVYDSVTLCLSAIFLCLIYLILFSNTDPFTISECILTTRLDKG